ncbi:MAG: LON peptidase substrate-binding domain-containing protein [Candidatus Sumerlaeia bacterium]|nr:LON peptidase substrate-binding domain-containing protein [Candidatus Sumerlaeia bacterium]
MSSVTLPIFPLPGLVLYPHTHLPLHIFEPRYVELVRDVLSGDQHMGTANIRQSADALDANPPRIHNVLTQARIVDYEELPDQRFFILLEGICRLKVVKEVHSNTPYRMVQANVLVDDLHQDDRVAINEARESLLQHAEQLAERSEDLKTRLRNLQNSHLHPGIIADVVASQVVRDPYTRQSLLEQTNILRRLRMVDIQLRTLVSGHALKRESWKSDYEE